jgi:hypothetical protein
MKRLSLLWILAAGLFMNACGSEESTENEGEEATTEEVASTGCEGCDTKTGECDESKCDKEKCDIANCEKKSSCDKSKCDKDCSNCDKSKCDKSKCDKNKSDTAIESEEEELDVVEEVATDA